MKSEGEKGNNITKTRVTTVITFLIDNSDQVAVFHLFMNGKIDIMSKNTEEDIKTPFKSTCLSFLI